MMYTWIDLSSLFLMVSIMIFIFGKYRNRNLETPLDEFSKDDLIYTSSSIFFIAGLLTIVFHFL